MTRTSGGVSSSQSVLLHWSWGPVKIPSEFVVFLIELRLFLDDFFIHDLVVQPEFSEDLEKFHFESVGSLVEVHMVLFVVLSASSSGLLRSLRIFQRFLRDGRGWVQTLPSVISQVRAAAALMAGMFFAGASQQPH